jgi:hypothetical protein
MKAQIAVSQASESVMSLSRLVNDARNETPWVGFATRRQQLGSGAPKLMASKSDFHFHRTWWQMNGFVTRRRGHEQLVNRQREVRAEMSWILSANRR